MDSVTGLKRADVFPALNKQQLTGGISGSMWFVAIAVSVTFAARFHSAILGGLVFALTWFVSSLMAKGEPQAIPIYIAATRLKAIYDGAMKANDR